MPGAFIVTGALSITGMLGIADVFAATGILVALGAGASHVQGVPGDGAILAASAPSVSALHGAEIIRQAHGLGCQ